MEFKLTCGTLYARSSAQLMFQMEHLYQYMTYIRKTHVVWNRIVYLEFRPSNVIPDSPSIFKFYATTYLKRQKWDSIFEEKFQAAVTQTMNIYATYALLFLCGRIH